MVTKGTPERYNNKTIKHSFVVYCSWYIAVLIMQLQSAGGTIETTGTIGTWNILTTTKQSNSQTVKREA